MCRTYKILLVLTFVALATALVVTKQSRQQLLQASRPTVSQKLPRLLDLGSHSCIPCKMMTPILDTLTTRYEGQLVVEFIDVWEDAEAAKRYGIRSIPTQIFFDATGNERFRHEGFWSRAEIEAKFVELGINLKESH